MRRLLLLGITLCSLAVASPAAADTMSVSITKAGFIPNPASVEVGDTVKWTNLDTVNRQVVSKEASFASPVLKPNETYTFTFTRAGRFLYEDPLVKKRGTVSVTVTARAITLAAARSVVTYGGSVGLSGTISAAAAGETAQILARPLGQSAFTKIADVTTTAGGEWSFAVKPTIQTTYQVRWKNSESGAVTLKVRPRVGLGIVSVGRGIFTTKVTADRSFAGKLVFFQRRNAVGHWVSLKRITLNASSAARFKARLPKGNSRIRVYLPEAQAGAGYLAGISAARLVRR
jgi:Cupredoxin-like domain